MTLRYIRIFINPSQLINNTIFQRYQLYVIARVDAGKTPVLYKLNDLKGDEVPGFFYKNQLLKTKKPDDHEYFRVEKILKRKQINKKPWALVKFLHYPPKFNQWITC